MCKMSVQKCSFRDKGSGFVNKKYLAKHNMANDPSLYCILRYAIFFFLAKFYGRKFNSKGQKIDVDQKMSLNSENGKRY